MNVSYYISRRIYKKGRYDKQLSTPILKIAISAIALGVVIMLVSVCTGLGLKKTIQDNTAALSAHIQISSLEQNLLFTSVPVSTVQKFYPTFPNVSQVQHIQIFATRPAVLKTEEEFEGVVLKGVSQDYHWDSFRPFIREGRIPHFGASESNDSLLLSTKTQSALSLKVGDRIKAYFVKDSGTPVMRYFTLAGTFKTGISDFDQNFAIADLRVIQQLNGWDSTQVGGFEIVLHNTSDIDQALPKIRSIVDWQLGITTIKDSYSDLLDWVQLFDINIAVIMVIMIIVSGVNMITVLLILILDKTQLIGILKSLGASDKVIRHIFLFNAFYIIARGLIWGNVIGLSLLLIQHYFGVISLDGDTYSVEVVPVYFNIWIILGVNIATAFINMLMLVLPSYFISKISPARSIKFGS